MRDSELPQNIVARLRDIRTLENAGIGLWVWELSEYDGMVLSDLGLTLCHEFPLYDDDGSCHGIEEYWVLSRNGKRLLELLDS